ncbi:hypothetical protein PAXRUDRAFT_164245 [Paxillus rubicundulus Ve08.2h10]|uniref:Uncharacterized protein n=1 Tax=Paxillus rubicundulus Ve08.2h10 TaxID=930991 RepID=A0A0D0CSJ3_9AGAM|nr:hypothetical protein PAXRUDRAFT_164245 [Paxillus rubicundulus Ve08.2h10]
MDGPLLWTCCQGLVPCPGNMPQQWSIHGPVILFVVFLFNAEPNSLHAIIQEYL